MRIIDNAYDAYWFLYEHPASVTEHPDHPLVDIDLYEFKGIGKSKIAARRGKKPDAEYTRAHKEKATRFDWHGQFIHNLDINYAKVNAITRRTDNEPADTVEVWLESGAAMWDESYYNSYIGNVHDIDLDCGAPTFDEALIILANLVLKKYGDYDATTTNT